MDVDKVYILGGLVDESIQKVLQVVTETSHSSSYVQSLKRHFVVDVTALVICINSFFSTSPPAEVEFLKGQRAQCPHGKTAHRRVHGEEEQRQEFPLQDPSC